MSIIALIISGLIFGGTAEFLMFGRDPGGFIIIILLGIVFVFLGRYIGRSLGLFRRPRRRQGRRI
jgi:uncharacterized membrane protein YeaQ/YmgE (transglycosylase-associated protein family)